MPRRSWPRSLALGTVVVTQTKTAAERVNELLHRRRTDRTTSPRPTATSTACSTGSTATTCASIKIEKSGHRLVQRIRQRDVGRYTHRIVNFVEGAAISIGRALFDSVLVLVISIYMLLDMQRLVARDRPAVPAARRPAADLADGARARLLRPRPDPAQPDHRRERRDRALDPRRHGAPARRRRATRSLFGGWVALTEVLPYLGPWLGAIPPALYALVVHPFSVVWVVLLFLGIHQIEGHIVVPKVMGSVLRLHPLLVIFGLLAGTNIDGLVGALIALPLLAVGRATWEFFAERVAFERWPGGGTIPVEVERRARCRSRRRRRARVAQRARSRTLSG